MPMPEHSRNSLRDPTLRAVLDRLHARADRQKLAFVKLLPRVVHGWLTGSKTGENLTHADLRDFLIPVSPEQGRFLYMTARAIGARNIAEFGTSFGVSTLYLAAAVRDNGGGRVIGTEIEPSKHAGALQHLEETGLSEWAEVRLGDATQTLKDLPAPVDMVLIDGEKSLYLDILRVLQPQLRARAIVLADNINTFERALRPYVDYVQSGENGFESMTLQISDGFEYSVYTGAPAA